VLAVRGGGVEPRNAALLNGEKRTQQNEMARLPIPTGVGLPGSESQRLGGARRQRSVALGHLSLAHDRQSQPALVQEHESQDHQEREHQDDRAAEHIADDARDEVQQAVEGPTHRVPDELRQHTEEKGSRNQPGGEQVDPVLLFEDGQGENFRELGPCDDRVELDRL